MVTVTLLPAAMKSFMWFGFELFGSMLLVCIILLIVELIKRVDKLLRPILQNLFNNMVMTRRMNKLIKEKFKGKVDKAGKPYILHLKKVAKNAPDLETKLVALGHDLIEDTDIILYEFIYKYELPEVIWIKIEILARKDGESYKEYIDRLIESKDKTVLFVKMEDLKHNMDLSRLKTITEEDINRNKKYEKHLERIIKVYKDL